MNADTAGMPPNQMPPIFVVGSGRSGTTLLYQLLTRHPDLAWTTEFTNRFPRFPQLSVLSRAPRSWDVRGLRPSIESPNALAFCGFSADQVRLARGPVKSEDLPGWSSACLRDFAEKHMRWMSRSGFVMKSTRNTLRIPALTSAFPDAFFVHIVRHPCGVIRSLMNVNWWPDLELWWRPGTPRALEAEGLDPYDLALEHWSRQVDAALDAKADIADGHYVEVRYEDLLSDPTTTMRQVVEGCRVPFTGTFEERVAAHGVDGSRASDWQNKLPLEVQKRVIASAASRLETLGYD